MKHSKITILLLSSLMVVFLLSTCKKDAELISGNKPPPVDDVPTLLVKNYVHSLYIDLIGREPLKSELDADVAFLRDSALSRNARIILIERLQSDESFVQGDSSYKDAYFHRFYQQVKVKMIEGTTDVDIENKTGSFTRQITIDSITGDSTHIASFRPPVAVHLRGDRFWHSIDGLLHNR